jgi:hypothetical protein
MATALVASTHQKYRNMIMKTSTKKTAPKTATLTKAQAVKNLKASELATTLNLAIEGAAVIESALEKKEDELVWATEAMAEAQVGIINTVGTIEDADGAEKVEQYLQWVYRSQGWEVRNVFEGTPAPKRIQETVSRIRQALKAKVDMSGVESVYGLRQAITKAKATPEAKAKPAKVKAPANVVEVRAEAAQHVTDLKDKIINLETVRATKKGKAKKVVESQIEAVSVERIGAEYTTIISAIPNDARQEAHKAALEILKGFGKAKKSA